MAVFDFDYEKSFNNGSSIFSQIHFNNGKEKEALTRLMKASSLGFEVANYAFILHDRDVDENGVAKVPHIHLIFVAKEGHSKKYWLDALFDAFGDLCDTREAITLTAVQYERGALRYLVHADHPYKAQYDPKSVHSFPAEWFSNALVDKPDKNPSIIKILDCPDKAAIYDLVGLANYSKCVKVWEDLKQEQFRRDYTSRVLDAYGDLVDEVIKLCFRLQPLREQSFALHPNWSVINKVLDDVEELQNDLKKKYEALRGDY